MAANNVFQMLAQQEIDRPERDLKRLQLKTLMDEAKYKEQTRTDLAAMPQSTQTTQTLGSMGPQGQPFSPEAPQMASMDPNAQGNKLSTMGLNINPMQQTETKPLTIADQFKQQYDYHIKNGRTDLAQGVMTHQLELSEKAAKVADHAYKTGGREGLASWLANNPTFAPLLGDPSHMQLGRDGVLYPAAGPDGVPVPGEFWHRDENGKVAFKTVKPEAVQTFAPGVGISDGKGGYTVPIAAPEKPDQEAMLDKRFNNQQKLTQMQIDAQDRRSAADRASSERKAAGKADPVDAIVAREAVKDLPKLRREARTAEASKPRLQQMVKLIDSGAGGIKGNALAAISGVFDTPATSEAELFKKLAAAGAGQLRTSVIGPGAVSNYEQNLLQAISGGGNGARTATKQLLKYYEQEADRTILNYNDAVDSAATVAPKVVKGFGKVGGQSGGGKRPLPKF